MVVDEIHLLGAAARGPLLEALLTRVRGVDSPVRIVGLSATVSNAGEIAEWLDGELLATTWRPSRLTWQLPMIPASSDRRTDADLRARVAVDLTMRVTEDGGSVLVFCGTKPNVRATALAVAASRGQNITGVDIDDTTGCTSCVRRSGSACTTRTGSSNAKPRLGSGTGSGTSWSLPPPSRPG